VDTNEQPKNTPAKPAVGGVVVEVETEMVPLEVNSTGSP
jgi:hypothetical protein